MTHIHDYEVNKIAERNLLHDIINPPKHTKTLNGHYSPIIHGCMNTRKCRAKFKSFLILLDSGCSSKIVMGRLLERLKPAKYAMMQWHTQAVNITTNLEFKVDFTLTSLSATNVVTWKCHVYEYTKGRYDMILGRDILTELGLNLKLYYHIIKENDGTLKGYTTRMVDLGTYGFKNLNTEKIIPKESFTNAYVEEIYESEHVRNSTK